MSKMEDDKLERELKALTLAELHHFMKFLAEATDEEFDSLMARKLAADYVAREFRRRIVGEISGLHDWIRDARESYSERLKHVYGRAAIRTESGRTEELVADNTGFRN